MSKENGFVPLRRGLWEHVRDGRMSHLEALAFVYICSQADTRTGVWKGSAKSLAGELDLKERTARDILEKMEHGDYIRRFAIPGLHHCYPILVHKFSITQGEHNGEQLDALNSLSATDLRYLPKESCEQDGEQSVEHGVEQSAAQRRIEKREQRKEKKPPADPRYGPFLEFAKSAYTLKHGEPPTWDCFGKDGAALAAFLRRAPHITPEEWQTRLSHYFESTEAFTLKQGGSLSYFIQKFDAFASGPILERPGGNNGTGKLSASDLATRNAKALGFVQ
jgi:hypothetical protein